MAFSLRSFLEPHQLADTLGWLTQLKQNLGHQFACDEFDPQTAAAELFPKQPQFAGVVQGMYSCNLGIDAEVWEWTFVCYNASIPMLRFGPAMFQENHHEKARPIRYIPSIPPRLRDSILGRTSALLSDGVGQLCVYEMPYPATLLRRIFKTTTLVRKGNLLHLYLYEKLSRHTVLNKMMRLECSADVREIWFRFAGDLARLFGADASQQCELGRNEVSAFLEKNDNRIIERGGETAVLNFCEAIGISAQEWFRAGSSHS